MGHPEHCKRAVFILMLFASAALSSACGVAKARTLGKEAAARFHEDFSSSRCEGIYETASAEFQRNATKEQWTALCAEAHRRWGRWKTATPSDGRSDESDVFIAQHVTTNGVVSDGYVVVLNYLSQFELGTASETLRFAVKDDGISLLAYGLMPTEPR